MYTIVFRDHSGEWHVVAAVGTWAHALTAFNAMLNTLIGLDYYDDCPPTVAKIVDGSRGAGNAFYEQAQALEGPIS